MVSYLFIISQPLVTVTSQNQEVLFVQICVTGFCWVSFLLLEFWYKGTRSREVSRVNGWFCSLEPRTSVERSPCDLSTGRATVSRQSVCPKTNEKNPSCELENTCWAGGWAGGGGCIVFYPFRDCCSQISVCNWRWRDKALWLISLGSLNIPTPGPSVSPPPFSPCKVHGSFMTRWVFVTQFRVGSQSTSPRLWCSFHDGADAQPVESQWAQGAGGVCQVDSAEEVMALVLPYKSVVPGEARRSQLENPKLWAFPDDICSFSNTHLASLVACTALIV